MQPELGARTGWRAHITRQLKHRDRTQKALYQDVIQSYNRLLEKSSLLKHLTESLQTDQHGRFHEEARDLCGPQDVEILISQKQRKVEEITNATRELAIEAVELKKKNQELDVRLEEQKARMGDLTDHMAILQQEKFFQEDEVFEVSCANSELKEKYDTLLDELHRTEEKLQKTEMEKQEMIGDLMRRKEVDAAKKNKQIDRTKTYKWVQELKQALILVVRPENIHHSHCGASPDSRHVDQPVGVECVRPVTRTSSVPHPHCASSQDSSTVEGSVSVERSCPVTRPRSQSLSPGSFDVFDSVRGFFNFRRQRYDSFSNMEWCPLSSVCVLCRLPSKALCNQVVHESEIHAVKFSPNSRIVATGGADRVIKFWDVENRTLQAYQTLEGSCSGITSIEFDPTGLQILASSYNGAVHLWRLDSRSIDSLTGHQGKVTAAKFTILQNRAVTCSMDRTVREWDLQKAACIRNISVPSFCSDVVCCDCCMVSGHHDKKIRFWDVRSAVCCREITLNDKITSLCMTQDQTQLLSCSRDDVLNLIDLRTSNIQQEFRADGFKCGCDWTKAILSPDGSYATAGSADGTIFIWNTKTGQLEKTLDGQHSAAVNAMTWSVSGNYVVSVDRGKKAVLWSEY
ncbi:protein Atg16l2-like [Discoglossus pictus]